ncbi:MAG: thioredoxin domain-containing protein [Terracidiphilus sp.]|jgi:protein-disulfide isomerase
MPDSVALRLSTYRAAARTGALALALGAVVLSLPAVAHAQFGAPQTTQVHDASALKPPAGAHVAIIEFYDLECPLCAQTNPQLVAAANQYKIPWIRYDFLIPGHPWSRQAAINARFFDTKSQKLGNDYRDYILANQVSIETPAELNTWTQKFSQAHGVGLPFAVDPMGKFAAQIQSDIDLGRRIGVEHTPTIFIVASGGHAPPYSEVVDRSRLFQTIDQVLAQVRK